MAPRIISRAAWGARPARSRRSIATPTPRVWVHHTAGSERGAAGVRSIQRFHQDVRGWSDIAYSFLVDDDGTIYEGRGVGIAGGHTKGDNSTSHAICLMGNFEDEQPTGAALAAAADLYAHGIASGWWADRLGGHRDAPGASTACPGRHLYGQLDRIREGDDDLMASADEIIRNQFNEAIMHARHRDAEEQRDWKSRRIQVDLLDAIPGLDRSRLSQETLDYLKATGNEPPEPHHEDEARARAEAAGVDVDV